MEQEKDKKEPDTQKELGYFSPLPPRPTAEPEQ